MAALISPLHMQFLQVLRFVWCPCIPWSRSSSLLNPPCFCTVQELWVLLRYEHPAQSGSFHQCDLHICEFGNDWRPQMLRFHFTLP
jgi:hypothetical protein